MASASEHRFARCRVCTHASVYRPGSPCRLCGGEVEDAPAPADLWTGWRCTCFQCLIKMC